MGVRFVIGRAGTGKTHGCVTEIAAAMRALPLGPPLYWIVPDQATFIMERLLVAQGWGGRGVIRREGAGGLARFGRRWFRLSGWRRFWPGRLDGRLRRR